MTKKGMVSPLLFLLLVFDVIHSTRGRDFAIATPSTQVSENRCSCFTLLFLRCQKKGQDPRQNQSKRQHQQSSVIRNDNNEMKHGAKELNYINIISRGGGVGDDKNKNEPPIVHWSHIWGISYIALTMLHFPVRKLGISSIHRLLDRYYHHINHDPQPLTTVIPQIILGIFVMILTGALRTKRFLTVVSLKMVHRTFRNLDVDQSTVWDQVLAPLFTLGIMPWTKRSVGFVIVLPLGIWVLKTVYGWIPQPYYDFFKAGVMMFGLGPLSVGMMVELGRCWWERFRFERKG